MIKRRRSVARKINFREDDPPRWQKYGIFEKCFRLGANEYDKAIVDIWKAYGEDGLDVMGQARAPDWAKKKEFANYYNTAKEHEKVYDYDRHFNSTFVPSFKAARERVKPWNEIITEIAREEDARALPLSVNRNYRREPKFTNYYLEPMFKHALSVAKFKYRARTGIFPELDKYRALGSYNENMPTGSNTCCTHLAKYGF